MNSAIDLNAELLSNPELAMLLLDAPISFNPVYADIAQLAMAGLLLSFYIDEFEAMQVNQDGWLVSNEARIRHLTKMSPKEQAQALDILSAKNLLRQRTSNASSNLEVFINFDQVLLQIVEFAKKNNRRDSRATISPH